MFDYSGLGGQDVLHHIWTASGNSIDTIQNIQSRFDPNICNMNDRLQPLLELFSYMAILAFFNGPMMALYLRKTLTSLAASLVVPISTFMLLDQLELALKTWVLPGLRLGDKGWLAWVLWCVGAYVIGRRKFMRLEVI